MFLCPGGAAAAEEGKGTAGRNAGEGGRAADELLQSLRQRQVSAHTHSQTRSLNDERCSSHFHSETSQSSWNRGLQEVGDDVPEQPALQDLFQGLSSDTTHGNVYLAAD